MKERPVLLMLSPPRTAFSTLRRLSNFKRDPAMVAKEYQEATGHLNFSAELVEWHRRRGWG
eukprot:12908180-Prorocentrum_lima.AAC.1